MRKQESEFNVLTSQLLDLEHRYRLVEEEMKRIQLNAKESEENSAGRAVEVENEHKKMSAELQNMDEEAGNLSKELERLKPVIEDKNAELAELKKALSISESQSRQMDDDNKSFSRKIKTAQKQYASIEIERGKLRDQQENIKRVRGTEEERIQNGENIAGKLEIQLKELEEVIKENEEQCDITDKKIKDVNHLRQLEREEADRFILENRDLQHNKGNLFKKIDDLELQNKLVDRKLDDIIGAIANRDKDLNGISSKLGYAEDRKASAMDQLRKIKIDNENLQALLDNYRDEANKEKQLRNEEVAQKYRLEEEKERLFRIAKNKEFEAQSAKRELEKYNDSHYQLLEEKSMISQELEALKNHAAVLESQNHNVSCC